VRKIPSNKLNVTLPFCTGNEPEGYRTKCPIDATRVYSWQPVGIVLLLSRIGDSGTVGNYPVTRLECVNAGHNAPMVLR
jgi:hypothetical protein